MLRSANAQAPVYECKLRLTVCRSDLRNRLKGDRGRWTSAHATPTRGRCVEGSGKRAVTMHSRGGPTATRIVNPAHGRRCRARSRKPPDRRVRAGSNYRWGTCQSTMVFGTADGIKRRSNRRAVEQSSATSHGLGSMMSPPTTGPRHDGALRLGPELLRTLRWSALVLAGR